MAFLNQNPDGTIVLGGSVLNLTASQQITINDIGKIISDETAVGFVQVTLPPLADSVNKGVIRLSASRLGNSTMGAYPHADDGGIGAFRIGTQSGLYSAYSSDVGNYLELYAKQVNQTKINVTTIVGTPTIGEIITGATSGATGYVVALVGSNLLVNGVVGTFVDTDALTGSDSGFTAVESGDPSSVPYNWVSLVVQGTWQDRD